MRAIVQDVYGETDVLALRDLETPAIGAGDVLVKVRAAGVDAGVWHLMTGTPYLMRLGFGLRGPRTKVRGYDVAGSVEAVGAGVTRFKVGDEVFGTCAGAFAEYARAPEKELAHKPANLTFEQAAAAPISATTALQALRDAGKVQAGQKVLVIGAAGGVGTLAVQLARHFGAEVTGVCSTTKVELVRSIGAAHVVDYTREDFSAGTARYDLILDTAGCRPLSVLRRALTPTGTVVLVGGEDEGRWFGAALTRMVRALLLAPFIKHKLRPLLSLVRPADLETLRELLAAGKLTPVIDRSYPLGEAAAAIAYQAKGSARGKIVLAV